MLTLVVLLLCTASCAAASANGKSMWRPFVVVGCVGQKERRGWIYYVAKKMHPMCRNVSAGFICSWDENKSAESAIALVHRDVDLLRWMRDDRIQWPQCSTAASYSYARWHHESNEEGWTTMCALQTCRILLLTGRWWNQILTRRSVTCCHIGQKWSWERTSVNGCMLSAVNMQPSNALLQETNQNIKCIAEGAVLCNLALLYIMFYYNTFYREPKPTWLL